MSAKNPQQFPTAERMKSKCLSKALNLAPTNHPDSRSYKPAKTEICTGLHFLKPLSQYITGFWVLGFFVPLETFLLPKQNP